MSLIFELAGYGFSAAVVSLVAAVRFGFNQDHHLHCETFSWLRNTHSPFPYPVLHLQFNSLFVEKRCKETRTMIKYKKKIRCFSSRVARPFIQFKVSSGDSSFLWYDLWHPRCLCLFYVKLIILGLRYYAIFPMPLPARWGICRHLGFYPSKMVPLTHTLRRFLVIRERKKKKIQHGPKVKGKLGDVNDPVWFPWILLQGDMGELMIRGRLCGPKD